MNLVFMNTLQKKINDEEVVMAQVVIQESNEVWLVTWSDIDHEREEVKKEWYKGESWDEMLAIFRKNLSEKIASGYMPTFDGEFKN